MSHAILELCTRDKTSEQIKQLNDDGCKKIVSQQK